MSATALLLERVQAALAPQYVVEREIGGGGMGIVFRGHDPRLGRAVAIKVLRPELASAKAATRFVREAQVLAQVRHPGIVPVYQAGESDGLFFYIMDLLSEGSTLADQLALGPLPAAKVAALGQELLAALACAHAQGVIHRDVKPANIFLRGEHALLGDFGIARLVTADATLTNTGDLIGTPAYGAPEQLAGAPATERSDLYSVGATLYEAATGRRWRRMDPASPATWATLPRPLREPLRRALAADPADRWPDATQFARALAARQGHRLAPWRYAAAAAGVTAVLAWLVPRALSPTGDVFSPPRRADADLAILPFTGAAELGRRVARYTTSRIEWFPRATLQPFVHSAAAHDSLRRAGRPVRGADLHAGLYVAGDIIRSNGQTILALEIRDSSDRLVRTIEVPGVQDDELAWSRAAADSLVSAVWPRHLAQFRDLARRGTRNLPAVRALVAGDDAFQLGEFAQAEDHYQRALEIEPGFTEALWKLTLLRRKPFDNILQQLRQSQAEELPELYRRLTAIQFEPDLERRLTQFREAAAEYPRNEVARFLYLDERFDRGPLVGVPLRPTLDLIVAASGANSYIAQALAGQAVWGFIRLGDADQAHAALERQRAAIAHHADAESRDRVQLLRLAYWARFHPLRATIARRYLMWTADAAYLDKLATMYRVAAAFDLPDLELALGRDLTRRSMSQAARMNGYLGQAVALGMRGQPAAALTVLDSGLALLGTLEARVQRGEWRLIPAVLGLPGVPASERAWARRYLEELLATEPALQARAAWALALDAHARQDTAAMARFHALVHERAGREAAAAWLDGILESLRLASRGRVTEALTRSAPLVAYDSAGHPGSPFARAVLYLHRGAWLVQAGRVDEAQRTWLWWQNSDIDNWLTSEPQAAEVDAMVSGYARLRLVAPALGLDSGAACADLRRVRELWRDAEPAVRAVYDRAAAARPCPS